MIRRRPTDSQGCDVVEGATTEPVPSVSEIAGEGVED